MDENIINHLDITKLKENRQKIIDILNYLYDLESAICKDDPSAFDLINNDDNQLGTNKYADFIEMIIDANAILIKFNNILTQKNRVNFHPI